MKICFKSTMSQFFLIKIVIFMPKDLYKLFQVELICQGDDENVIKKGRPPFSCPWYDEFGYLSHFDNCRQLEILDKFSSIL